MTPERWTDAEGDAWPITGHECAVCGLPLDPVLAATSWTDHGERAP